MSELTLTTPALDKDMAREFLACLDPCATRFTFQFFGDGDDGYAEIFHGTLDEVWPRVETLNTPERRAGIFVTINETDFRGRSTKNIIRVRALYVDADSDEQVERCGQIFAACDITPSMVVKTGRGAHYYFLTEVPRDQFREWQEMLLDKLGTDRAIKDLPRVMRLPGTLHLKNPIEPRLVQLEKLGTSAHRWKLSELASKLELSPVMTSASSPAAVPTPSGRWCNAANFTDAARQRLQKLFGHLTVTSLSDGLYTDVEEIRSAVAAIPAAAIADEQGWLEVARALAHEAAIHKTQAEQLWQILDTASSQAPGYDLSDNRKRWDRYVSEAFNDDNPITIATVYYLAHKHGWQGWSAAEIAPSIAAVPNSPRAVPVASLPLVPPKRQWLHGNDLMRSAVSMLVAPGGKAKSTWLLTCGLACASGRPLLGAHVFGGPLSVLYISAEDPTNEIALRLRAAMQHHGLSDADVASYQVIGGEKWGLPLLRSVGPAPILDDPGWSALNAELDHFKPDVLIIDPLINFMGGVDANDNSAAALLMGQLAALAARRRMAIMVAHHAAKGRDPKSAESAMGAASFVNLCRIALGIEPLAEKDAGRLGLPPWEAKSVFRVIGTKQNFSPPNTDDRWYRTTSVEIQNQQPPTYPNGDKVAVVETFTPGTSGPAYPDGLIKSALEAIDRASPPLSNASQAKTRKAAPVIARAIAPHRSGMASEQDGKAILDHLIDAGLLEVKPVKIHRPGKGPYEPNGLVLTALGRIFVQQAAEAPQSPQTTAVVSAGTAVCPVRDQPCGSPAPLGGCGGSAGGGTTADT
ncbi:AAA family ATPase [Bradyrhizobium sp. Ash2021]|uniref:AAA family ATPase n=1 Tax=Bradyrhizobium sp. Ash2021 TaxID=2954771 RepID=UPI0028151B27|nr:AAA family ATPase [Bradyrhizobium sp. Ash2021]WMT75428.1 AAA family ATPase [Bradyrhizobium sp. Ash2021]